MHQGSLFNLGVSVDSTSDRSDFPDSNMDIPDLNQRVEKETFGHVQCNDSNISHLSKIYSGPFSEVHLVTESINDRADLRSKIPELSTLYRRFERSLMLGLCQEAYQGLR